MRISYRFRWIPFIATLVAMAIGIALGEWQLRRATEKEAIEARMQARAAAPRVIIGAASLVPTMEFRQAAVRGEFVASWPVYLNNRPYRSQAGFYLLMPFKIAGTNQHILVARGWLPRNFSQRTQLPPLVTPSGEIEIQGTLHGKLGHLLQLGVADPLQPGAIVQNLDIASFAAASQLPMQPLFLEQSGAGDDGLVRDWPRPSSGIDKHLGYAFQWYGLAVMAFFFFVVTGFRRGTK